MPRRARQKSESRIYHIILRGFNRQNMFEDEEDNYRFLQTLIHYKEISEFELYAYCLMGNHVHLLLRADKEPLEQIMRRICGTYVYWYNRKYERIGNLFQDRFKNELVEDDPYFLIVLLYIHQSKDDDCLDIDDRYRITDQEAGEMIRSRFNLKSSQDMQKLDRDKRDAFVKQLKEEYNLSIRQIERLTGINRGIISRA